MDIMEIAGIIPWIILMEGNTVINALFLFHIRKFKVV